MCHSGKLCLASLLVSVFPSMNISCQCEKHSRQCNSSCYFPWATGDVGMCRVGASTAPEGARPWSPVAWLHTSICLHLFTTTSGIRQYVPKIATSLKGLISWRLYVSVGRSQRVGARQPANMGVSRKSAGGCPRASVPDFSMRPKANPATQSLELPLVYKSVSFKCMLCFQRPSSYVPQNAQAA